MKEPNIKGWRRRRVRRKTSVDAVDRNSTCIAMALTDRNGDGPLS